MKRITIIHKEHDEECFEILKQAIIENKELKKYRIDKDTLLANLPSKVVNEFLDFIGTDKQHRQLMLHLIKEGVLVITCTEE
ncbi:hypothetical protein [Draconibacterium orientale]|uniref:hypothetical protein n=1 Tax=Draconibacterium orientale TaxID=1168034 RepID=UPI002A0A72FF|nr:hypothetical protein [Draconibacterium orientale]